MLGRFDDTPIGIVGAIAGGVLATMAIVGTAAGQDVVRRGDDGQCVVSFGAREVPVEEMRRALDQGCGDAAAAEEKTRGLSKRGVMVVTENPACPERTSLAFDFQFGFDSADLSPDARQQLGRVASLIESYPACGVVLEGHTDASGAESYNQQLSERRAIAVQAFLEQKAVTADRLSAVGRGESRLLVPEAPNAGANRRVEIMITGP